MDRRAFTAALTALAGQWLRLGSARGDELNPPEPSTGHYNALMPTMGGRQFWADELFFHDWHIQRNVLTGHYRLLDSNNVRHAWGSFDQCATKLEQIKVKHRLQPMIGPSVVVLHGLFRSASSMSNISRYLHEKGGYTVFNANYPTTRGTVADHAAVLEKIVASLDGIEEINFVGHSLGNLVIRHYLGDHTDPAHGIVPDARIKRTVMLGPPNQGAQMAEALAGNRMFHLVAGASGSQLAREWALLETKLATPAGQFGILAGGRGVESGYNPWLGQDNDMVVSVESTRLPGAADFAVLPVLHSLMMDDAKIQEYALRFLQQGYFISADQRHPIEPARDT